MLLVITAAAAESTLLRQHLNPADETPVGSAHLLQGKLCGQQVILCHSGIGPSSMAMQLTRLLERYNVAAVLLCGCGGSYPDSGLGNGELVLASEEIFGDLGVAEEARFIPLEQLDIPQDPQLGPLFRQRLPLDQRLLCWATGLLPEARVGTFVTVSCCSGYPQLSRTLQLRTGGLCENMEGAAAAQVCAEYATPLLELRGISNPTGTRDPGSWDIRAGANAAQQGLLKLLDHWPPQEETSCDT